MRGEALADVARQRLAGRRAHAHARRGARRQLGRRKHRRVQRRDAVEHRGPLLEDAAEHRLRRGALGHQDRRRTRRQRERQRVAQPVREEELRRGEADVVLGEPQDVLRVQHVGPVRVGMRVDGAFRRAGRARRIEPERRLVGVRGSRFPRGSRAGDIGAEIALPRCERSGRIDHPHRLDVVPAALHRLLERRQQRGRYDRGPRAAVRQHERVVVGGEQRVDGDRHDAAVDRAEERDRPIDGVVSEEQQALLAPQPVVAQHLREAAHPIRQFAVGEPRAIVDVGDAPGARRVAADEVRRKVERLRRSGRDGHGACTADGRRRSHGWRRSEARDCIIVR